MTPSSISIHAAHGTVRPAASSVGLSPVVVSSALDVIMVCLVMGSSCIGTSWRSTHLRSPT